MAQRVRVELTDGFLASDLTWHVVDHSTVSDCGDGTWAVEIDVRGNVSHVLSQIRDWAVLRGLESIVVEVDERRFSLVVRTVEE